VFAHAQEDSRTLFFGSSANCDRIGKGHFPEIFVYAFGILLFKRETHLAHHGLDDGQDLSFWFQPCAKDIKMLPGVGAQESFAHLAAGGISGAKE